MKPQLSAREASRQSPHDNYNQIIFYSPSSRSVRHLVSRWCDRAAEYRQIQSLRRHGSRKTGSLSLPSFIKWPVASGWVAVLCQASKRTVFQAMGDFESDRALSQQEAISQSTRKLTANHTVLSFYDRWVEAKELSLEGLFAAFYLFICIYFSLQQVQPLSWLTEERICLFSQLQYASI